MILQAIRHEIAILAWTVQLQIVHFMHIMTGVFYKLSEVRTLVYKMIWVVILITKKSLMISRYILASIGVFTLC